MSQPEAIFHTGMAKVSRGAHFDVAGARIHIGDVHFQVHLATENVLTSRNLREWANENP